MHLALITCQVKQLILQTRSATGLVDYITVKKSTCHLRLFLRWFLNELIDGASTSTWDKLLHLFTTLWEKKYNLVSLRQDFFTNFQLWTLVELSAAAWKKDDHGQAGSPFIILNTSIRSARFLLSSKVQSLYNQLLLDPLISIRPQYSICTRFVYKHDNIVTPSSHSNRLAGVKTLRT